MEKGHAVVPLSALALLFYDQLLWGKMGTIKVRSSCTSRCGGGDNFHGLAWKHANIAWPAGAGPLVPATGALVPVPKWVPAWSAEEGEWYSAALSHKLGKLNL
uniref:Uncharacterized protein n=1 Tax=Xenopus tropicalis TaxID=8364 RepID=A0A6I8QY47_XENTR